MKTRTGPAVDRPCGADSGISDLLSIMKKLRDPECGCPWDIEQDMRSIAPHTLEEAYEVVEAIEHDDMDQIEAELGDLLLQVVFLSQIADEQGRFDFNSVTRRLAEKLIDRHPHVFSDRDDIQTAHDQQEFWESRKARERGDVAPGSLMDSICSALPAQTRALKVQQAASRLNYDFSSVDEAVGKIYEELDELAVARIKGGADAIEEEIGDLIFTAVNIARLMNVDPEQALRGATGKFTERFRSIECMIEESGVNPADLTPAERDRLWEMTKSG